MPSVFLSYSRDDLALIEQLEARLKASSPNISIWRDQEKIYGGQKWPKVLGEAIADQDVFLLAWSKNAKASHFVEFEWCTAIALKKTIIPCLLDSTALPPSLTATNAVSIDDPSQLVTALTGARLVADGVRRAEISNKLDQITDTEPSAVLKAAKTLFDQRGWTVQGHVIQGEHVTVHLGEGPKPSQKGLLEKWHTWVVIVGGILAAILSAVQIKNSISPQGPSEKPGVVPAPPEKPAPTPIHLLGGQVLDEVTLTPLEGVLVSIPEFQKTDNTKKDGSFRIEVESSQEKTVTFTAQKDGYKIYTERATLGNTDLRFALEKLE